MHECDEVCWLTENLCTNIWTQDWSSTGTCEPQCTVWCVANMAASCGWRAWLQLTNAGVGAHHQHGEVGAVAGETEDGGLQVLVVSGEVDEGDHLGRALADLLSCPRLTVVHNLFDTRQDDEAFKITRGADMCSGKLCGNLNIRLEYFFWSFQRLSWTHHQKYSKQILHQ